MPSLPSGIDGIANGDAHRHFRVMGDLPNLILDIRNPWVVVDCVVGSFIRDHSCGCRRLFWSAATTVASGFVGEAEFVGSYHARHQSVLYASASAAKRRRAVRR